MKLILQYLIIMKNIKLLLFLFLLSSVIPSYLSENDNEAAENNNDDQEEHGSQKMRTTNSAGAPYFKKRDMPWKIAKTSGSSVGLSCFAKGRQPLNTTWSKDGFPPSRNSSTIKYRKGVMIMEDVTSSDSGNYTCFVCNRIGCVNHTFYLEVIARYPSAPIIMQGYPKNITVPVNTNARFECPTLSEIKPAISWTKPNTVSEEGENPLEVVSIVQANNDGIENPEVLELKNVTYADVGWYICAAANGQGITYANAYLNVINGTYADNSKKESIEDHKPL